MIFVKQDCPLCNQSEATLEIEPDIYPTKENIEKSWRGFLKQKVFFAYARCNCGMLYAESYPHSSYLKQLYSFMDNNEHSGNTRLEMLTQSKYADEITKNIGEKSHINVLEIGPDNGKLVQALSKKISIDSYHAVEPNINVHNQLKKFPNTKIYTELKTCLDEGMKYDCIVMVHVADHLPNIKNIIRGLNSALKKGGGLHIVVHNEMSWLSRLLRKRWPAYCLQHPHLFNPKTITALLYSCNFRDVEVNRTINYFEAGYLLHHLVLAFLKISIRLPRLFDIRLKLGNIMVTGKK